MIPGNIDQIACSGAILRKRIVGEEFVHERLERLGELLVAAARLGEDESALLDVGLQDLLLGVVSRRRPPIGPWPFM